MRLLVTGFPGFPGQPHNPSQVLVEFIQSGGLSVPGATVNATLLPVEYNRIEQEFLRAFKEYRPQLWIALGVCRRSQPIYLEALGRNWDAAERPDNTGEIRLGLPIIPGAAEQLPATLDLNDLQRELEEGGLPAEISQDAGTYLCNHLLYFALHHFRHFDKTCEFLFVHIAAGESGLPPEKLCLALQIMTMWFQNRGTTQATIII